MQCELARKCINFIQARNIKTNEPLTSGICFQMNCARNPMASTSMDLYKTMVMRTEEEKKRLEIDKEIERRAQIKVEQKLDLQKRPPQEPLTAEEVPTKIPRDYASVKDVMKKVTQAEEQKRETDAYYNLNPEDFRQGGEENPEPEERVSYPRMPVAAPPEDRSYSDLPPSIIMAEEPKEIPKPYPSVKEVRQQIDDKRQMTVEEARRVLAEAEAREAAQRQPKEEDYYEALDEALAFPDETVEDEVNEDDENREFMLHSIQRTKSTKTLQSIARQAEEAGYTEIMQIALGKIDEINKEKMAKVRSYKNTGE